MKNIHILSLALFIFLTGCSSSSDANRQIQDEMIAIHDEVMPMMGDFVRKIQKIDTILVNMDQYKTQTPELDTAQQRLELTELQNRLENAHDSMNDWMHDLNLNFDGMSKDETKAYLETEKEKIQEINTEFNRVSAAADSALNSYQL